MEWSRAADEIIQRTGVTRGYCLDLGCGDGSLAHELAQRTDLHIYAVESDPDLVAAARARLTAAGLYGVRVTVLERDCEDTGLPAYFADLIVSKRGIEQGGAVAESGQVERLQRPEGGLSCFGQPGHIGMRFRVIGNLESQVVQPLDLIPRQEVLFVVGGTLSLGNEEGCPKAKLLQDRCDVGDV